MTQLAAVDAGADAIGLNFYRGSKRCVSVDVARQIVDAVSQHAACVGVFVNASADEIHAMCEQARLRGRAVTRKRAARVNQVARSRIMR